MMKPFKISVLSLSAMIVIAASGFAVEAPQAAADHQALAAAYEQKAAAMAAIIQEHEQMKSDYRKRFYVNEKITPPGRFLAMNSHCDAIIGDTQKLKSDYLDFAKWHKMRAAELEGK